MEEKKTTVVKPAVKKVYEKPQIVSEEVFETLALACCKSNNCKNFGLPRGMHAVS